MDRRSFIKRSCATGAGLLIGGPIAHAQNEPVRIIMSGYSPPTSSFGRGLTLIGDRLTERFGDQVEVKYVYNIVDVGYQPFDLQWLVDSGVLTMAYQSMPTGVPELEVASLPFVFPDTDAARAAMDGELGDAAIRTIEGQNNFVVLGFFENGFRHVSNSVRPVSRPADLAGLKIRVIGDIQARTFESLGAQPMIVDFPEIIPSLMDGRLDGQENPFENTVSLGMHEYQRYHTATGHSYLSRPIFVNRQTYESWPGDLQETMRAAVSEAVTLQRGLHDQAEIDAANLIVEEGGEAIYLTREQRQEFLRAVAPVHEEARREYSQALLDLVNL